MRGAEAAVGGRRVSRRPAGAPVPGLGHRLVAQNSPATRAASRKHGEPAQQCWTDEVGAAYSLQPDRRAGGARRAWLSHSWLQEMLGCGWSDWAGPGRLLHPQLWAPSPEHSVTPLVYVSPDNLLDVPRTCQGHSHVSWDLGSPLNTFIN